MSALVVLAGGWRVRPSRSGGLCSRLAHRWSVPVRLRGLEARRCSRCGAEAWRKERV